MNKEIKYNGYSAVPSDYECADGELATSIGVVQEDGALKAVFQPEEIFSLPANHKVVYIHKTSAFKYYIVKKTTTNELYFTEGNTESSQSLQHLHSFSGVTINAIEAIGNTLIVLTSDGMNYFLWKSANEGYLYLGTQIPECPISFGLQGEVKRSDVFSISFDSIGEGDIWNEFSDNNKSRITEQVLAKVNKFIAENSTNAGRFIYPFLIRYAYRLYDGSLTMHSMPVLMIASSDLAPQVFWEHIKGKGSYNSAELRVVGVFHKLDYAVLLQSRIDALKNWQDVVRSVDVFISKPIYTYDQNGQCTKFANGENYDSYCICKHINQAASTTTYPLRYQKNGFNKLYAFTFNPSNLSYPVGRLMIPRRSVDAVKEDIRSCSQFYFLESIRIEQLSTTRKEITVEEDYLQSLVNREVMSDDYDSHDRLIPRYAFAYNSRLNIANLGKELYNVYNAGAQFCYNDGYVANFPGSSPTIMDDKVSFTVYFFIKQDGRDIVVQGESYQLSIYNPILFLFYPNINAYKAVVVYWNYFPTCYEIALEQHNFLNGAFYFGGWENPSTSGSVPSESPKASRIIDIPNKIYTSEVNNPFYFPVLGINTVGTGAIIGISSAAKALSEGQFGQFPLYAFTTDGVWALEVSSTGSYSARQPVTRDVCINPESITQIDSAVLFATNRGIMLISGSQTMCITDTINSPDLFSINDLPKKDALISIYNSKQKSEITVDEIKYLPFLDFLLSCKMIYDYTHQRIIVYNSSVRYAYVFSLKSKMWGMMLSDITDNVNSYPDALAMSIKIEGSSEIPILVDCSKESSEDVTALIVTRPFKFDDPNLLKTIDTIIQRGYFRKENISQILYGSNDLYNWHVVWSSKDKYLRGFRGTPYKTFRLALIATLNKTESIFGFSVQFNPRMTNQLR